MSLRRLLIASVLLGALLAAAWLLRPSETRRIRRQMDRLAERISKTENESSAVMALKMNALGDLFESQVEVDLADFPGNGAYASSEIASHVARFRPTCRSVKLSFHDLTIETRSDTAAGARCTARISAVAANGETQDDTRLLQATLRKGTDGTWRFAGFTEIRVLQR